MNGVRFRIGRPDDIPALRQLIESAYRGKSARAGWTHEADLLGGKRTSEAELEEIVTSPDQVMLLAEVSDSLVGCVCLTRLPEDVTYLGMLSVNPDLQAGGLGRRLLSAAETEAVSRFGTSLMEMTVISTRSELIAWYERRGYRLTGERRPFPEGDYGAFSPQDLEFVVLEKPMMRPDPAEAGLGSDQMLSPGSQTFGN